MGRNLRPPAHRHQPDGDSGNSGLSSVPESDVADGAAESELSFDAGALVDEEAGDDAVDEDDGAGDGEVAATGDCDSAVG
jgi:hypothetical protein